MPIPYDNFGTYWVLKPYLYTSPYFVLAALGTIAGIIMAYFELRRRKIGKELKHTILASITAYVFAIAFARLLYFFGPWSWEEYPALASKILGIFSLKPGMVFYGGLIGGLFGLWIYTKTKRLDFWTFADAVAPSGGLILFFGRIGCFTAGCCYGLAPHLHLPWTLQWGDKLMHPTQLYSSVFGLLLFVVMTELKYRQTLKKLFNGYVVLWGVLLYSIGRFLMEFLRYYDARFFGITSSQIISIGLFAICSILLIRNYKNIKSSKKG